MYKNRDIKKRFIAQKRRAELQARDAVRQAYYARLEREKQGIFEEPAPAVIQAEEPTVAKLVRKQKAVSEPEPAKDVLEPLYFTRLAKAGWYNVIGPAGEPVNAKLLRLAAAEETAERMNNGADS